MQVPAFDAHVLQDRADAGGLGVVLQRLEEVLGVDDLEHVGEVLDVVSRSTQEIDVGRDGVSDEDDVSRRLLGQRGVFRLQRLSQSWLSHSWHSGSWFRNGCIDSLGAERCLEAGIHALRDVFEGYPFALAKSLLESVRTASHMQTVDVTGVLLNAEMPGTNFLEPVLPVLTRSESDNIACVQRGNADFG